MMEVHKKHTAYATHLCVLNPDSTSKVAAVALCLNKDGYIEIGLVPRGETSRLRNDNGDRIRDALQGGSIRVIPEAFSVSAHADYLRLPANEVPTAMSIRGRSGSVVETLNMLARSPLKISSEATASLGQAYVNQLVGVGRF